MKQLTLIGKPNSGKSSLFNLLTGLNQKIGNYGGVTVERKVGKFLDYEVIDLPGLKSLKAGSPEEKIAKEAILEHCKTQSPLIVYIANGMQLEDSLLLFSELADLQVPMILVINFKDDLERNKINLDITTLSNTLGCPVATMNSRNGDGIDQLKSILQNENYSIPNAVCRSLYDSIDGDEIVNTYLPRIENAEGIHYEERKDEFNKRQKIIGSLIKSTVSIEEDSDYLARSQKWDKILLHPIFGVLIFLFVLYVVFQSVFAFSGYPMDWIDQSISALSSWTKQILPQGWLNDLISDAIIQGIGGVIIFIPQIAILFFFLGLLEHSGYMARISFIADNFLRKFGLSGKSIIPLMSSWACAIPAIMGTRVIDDPKERMAVIMASPLMTCSARLPVYTILIAVILPKGDGSFFGAQGLALLGLYLIGVIATLLVALYISKRSKMESNPFWSLELPVYRIPNWRNIFNNVYQKTKSFVIEAGKVILAISIVLWLLSTNSPKSESYIDNQYQTYTSTNPDGGEISKESYELEYSYLGYLGKGFEPIIAPLGYDWKIGIALLSSFAAREVFVGTLSTIYSIGDDEERTIIQRLKNEINLSTGGPRFTYATTISLLLFYVFAMQCMSTVAIVRKETGGWKYAIIQFLFMFVLAYVFSFLAYQLLK